MASFLLGSLDGVELGQVARGVDQLDGCDAALDHGDWERDVDKDGDQPVEIGERPEVERAEIEYFEVSKMDFSTFF